MEGRAEETSAEGGKRESLDATHTSSEQLVYSYMYRQTISQGLRERHFGPKELLAATPIRSHVTIRKAIDGLIEKQSIEIISYKIGDPYGPRYRVYDPRTIYRRRQQLGMRIDPVTKRIINLGEETEEEASDEGSATPTATPTTAPTVTTTSTPTERASNPYSDPTKFYRGAPTDSIGATPTNSVGVSSLNKKDLFTENSTPPSSSSNAVSDDDDDAVFLRSIREVYEQATGNRWTPADEATAMRGRDIPATIWGLAICYCVDRAPNHRFQRLAYVLEEARHHYESMSSISLAELERGLRRALGRVMQAQAVGWSVETVLGGSRAEPGGEGN